MTRPLYDPTSDRDAFDVTPLAALIEEVRNLFADTHGVQLSYGDIARRSKDRLTRQRVQQLANDPIKAMPSPEVILGLALGLAVPESVVLERALASSGYYKPRGERREEAPRATTTTKADVEHAGVGRPKDYAKAARKGTPRQVQIDAVEPDHNVDPEGPEGGA